MKKYCKILIVSVICLALLKQNCINGALTNDIIEPDAIDEIINDYDIQGKAGNEFVQSVLKEKEALLQN